MCFLLEKIYIMSTLKLKNILEPGGQVFSFNKKNKDILKSKNLEPSLHYGKMDEMFRNKYWIIVAAEMIAERILHCCIYWRFSLFIFADEMEC